MTINVLIIKFSSSLKTAYNLVKKYKQFGKSAFSHGNHNRKTTNTKSQEFCDKIISIYKKIDCDINFRHFLSILKRDYNIIEYLTIVSHRKVDNGCTIKYNNNYYKIYNSNGSPLMIKPKSECLVVKTFDDKYFVLFDSTQYYMKKLETHRKDSILESKVTKEQEKYIPAWNHPWRKEFYENYLKYYRPNQQNNYAYDYK